MGRAQPITSQHKRVPPQAPELWAGIECTVNRVRNSYSDQLRKTGHWEREDDLDRIAALGIRTLRQPALWEHVSPRSPAEFDWRWLDARLRRLRALGMTPILGLMHHGSGPSYTNLVDTRFPKFLSSYAGALAARYPWASRFTPVNEPNTTARFSCLYGHWYPHRRDALSYARALINQCKATVLAMQAIREVNPEAELVQTEDLGKTYSTAELAYQAEFENERRWLTYDLLCGRVVPGAWMHDWLTYVGVDPDELAWLADNPCPPEVLGINHYVTSERFLDHRIENFQSHRLGTNGRHTYADVEAVRICGEGIGSFEMALTDTWERYGRPIALTEVHLGCTREEQLRWLAGAWDAAAKCRRAGADVRAITVWAMFGTVDWCSLLTRNDRHYEPGVFDVRASRPRPTALAKVVRQIASGQKPDHPVLASPGWWQRADRFGYSPVLGAKGLTATGARVSKSASPAKPILITGATGTLGHAFGRLCAARGLAYKLLSRAEMDIASPASVRAALQTYRPWAVVNAAGYVRVDDAESEREACWLANADGPSVLALACADAGIRLVTFSSDLIFDGRQTEPYREGDAPNPLNVYGSSKLAAERSVLRIMPEALVVRTSAFFGPWDRYNFVDLVVRQLAQGLELICASDQVVSPTFVPELVNATLDLLIDGEHGIWHLANDGVVTWEEFARLTAMRAGLSASLITGASSDELNLAAPRPAFSALQTRRGLALSELEEAVYQCLQQREVRVVSSAAYVG